MKKVLYSYSGGVKLFGELVTSTYKATTMAVSAKEAAANLAYRYKREHGYTAATRITLTGTPVAIS